MSYDRRRLRGHHPAACTCADCVEKRRRGSAKPPPRAPFRNVSPRPDYQRGGNTAPVSHRTPDSGQQRGTGSQPPSGPPPGMLLGSPQGRTRDGANGPFAILRRWLLIIAVAVGITMVVLYLTDSGPFAPPGGDGPVAVAAPDPTDEPVATPSPTATPTAETHGAAVVATKPPPQPTGPAPVVTPTPPAFTAVPAGLAPGTAEPTRTSLPAATPVATAAPLPTATVRPTADTETHGNALAYQHPRGLLRRLCLPTLRGPPAPRGLRPPPGRLALPRPWHPQWATCL